MTKWKQFWVTRVYRIDGVLDEYRQAQLNRLGNRAFTGLAVYLLLISGGAVIGLLANGTPRWVALSLLGGDVLGVLLTNTWLKTQVTKLQLDQLDVTPTNVHGYLRLVRQRSLEEGISFAVFFWGVQVALDWPQTWRQIFWSGAAVKLLALSLVEGFILWYVVYFQRRAAVEDALARTKRELE